MDAHGFLVACRKAELRRELGNASPPVMLRALEADWAAENLIWGGIATAILAWMTSPSPLLSPPKG